MCNICTLNHRNHCQKKLNFHSKLLYILNLSSKSQKSVFSAIEEAAILIDVEIQNIFEKEKDLHYLISTFTIKIEQKKMWHLCKSMQIYNLNRRESKNKPTGMWPVVFQKRCRVIHGERVMLATNGTINYLL